MLIEDMKFLIPQNWTPMDMVKDRYKIIPVDPFSEEFTRVSSLVNKGARVANNWDGIYRVQNPFLYTKFRLKIFDFSRKGGYEIKLLYHDTSRDNSASIAEINFDWRFGQRFKYGPGVYFSTSPWLAHKHSSSANGRYRSMFIAEVLTQNVQKVDGEVFLPDYGFDTVNCHSGDTYVKYFDGEYYPLYFVDYVC